MSPSFVATSGPSSFGEMLTGRPHPVANVSGRVSLPGPPQQQFARQTGSGHFSRFSEALSLFCAPFLESFLVFDVSTLVHALLHSVGGGGSATGVLITGLRRGGSVMATFCYLQITTATDFRLSKLFF